jgi:hypothetical protein
MRIFVFEDLNMLPFEFLGDPIKLFEGLTLFFVNIQIYFFFFIGLALDFDVVEIMF